MKGFTTHKRTALSHQGKYRHAVAEISAMLPPKFPLLIFPDLKPSSIEPEFKSGRANARHENLYLFKVAIWA